MEAQALYDYNSLMQQMLDTNASYLSDAVTIVLALGAISGILVYLAGIKPFQKNIEQASEDLSSMKNKLVELTEKAEKSEAKLGESIDDFEWRFAKLEIDVQSISDEANSKITDNVQKLERIISEMSQKIEDLKTKTEIEVSENVRQIKASQNFNELFHKYNYIELWEEVGNLEKALEMCLESLQLEVEDNITDVARRIALRNVEGILQRRSEIDKEEVRSTLNEIKKIANELIASSDQGKTKEIARATIGSIDDFLSKTRTIDESE